MSITKKSKNLRRRVKNAFLGPENGPKSFKSIFFKTSSTFNPEFFRAKSTQKNLTKNTNGHVARPSYFFYLVLKLRSNGQSRALILNISKTLGNPFFMLHNNKQRMTDTK